jgi:hypothetical protein
LVERLPYKQNVTGSSPVLPKFKDEKLGLYLWCTSKGSPLQEVTCLLKEKLQEFKTYLEN